MVKVIVIEDLDCPNCAAKIQEGINKIEGVNTATVSFLAQKITVDFDESVADVIDKKIEDICKAVEPDCTLTF